MFRNFILTPFYSLPSKLELKPPISDEMIHSPFYSFPCELHHKISAFLFFLALNFLHNFAVHSPQPNVEFIPSQ